MMFTPLLILLGIISITSAQNHIGPGAYKWHNNQFGKEYEENLGEASKDFLEPGYEYYTDMMPDYSDKGDMYTPKSELLFSKGYISETKHF